MSDETMKAKLVAAQRAFETGKYSDAEKLLQELPQDDAKVRNNLVMTQYMQKKVDTEEAIRTLSAGITENTEKDKKGGRQVGPASITLAYEGQEAAVLNCASLYALSGRTAEAIALLRCMLQLGTEVELSVRARALCLFQCLTRPASSLTGGSGRSKTDEELVQSVLAEAMPALSETPELLQMVTVAFADSSNLHEVFKAPAANSMEQAVYLNNLGVLSLYDGKTNVASLCFVKAKTVATQATGDGLSLVPPMSYNAGLCALLREDYTNAIDNFLAVEESFRDSPTFWLRFAEAALGDAQRLAQKDARAKYEQQQTAFAAAIRAGKVLPNFETLVLPGATFTRGPVAQEGAADAKKEGQTTMSAQLELAAVAVQNALFLLLPAGKSFAAAVEAAPHNETQAVYAMLYWSCLELLRDNYLATVVVGKELLSRHDQKSLPSTVHATLLTYMVDALTHLNDPDQALKVLRKASLSSLVVGENADVAQRSRIEALFVNLAVTHILTGSWNQAHGIIDTVVARLHESAPAEAIEFTPERDVVFAYQILYVFLELAQGNTEKVSELLQKIVWSV